MLKWRHKRSAEYRTLCREVILNSQGSRRDTYLAQKSAEYRILYSVVISHMADVEIFYALPRSAEYRKLYDKLSVIEPIVSG